MAKCPPVTARTSASLGTRLSPGYGSQDCFAGGRNADGASAPLGWEWLSQTMCGTKPRGTILAVSVASGVQGSHGVLGCSLPFSLDPQTYVSDRSRIARHRLPWPAAPPQQFRHSTSLLFPISSSGVHNVGTSYPYCSTTRRMARCSSAFAMCRQFHVSRNSQP